MFCAFWALRENKKCAPLVCRSGGFATTESLMESCSWEKKMIAQAKEELQVLETQYPNRFDHLKLELKSFIILLESQNLMLHEYNNSKPTSTASTQASICGRKRKRKKSVFDEIEDTAGLTMHTGCSRVGRRDRVDVALDRAQACLRKIQQLKTSL